MNIQGVLMTVLALAALGFVVVYAQRFIATLASRAGV